MSLKGKPSIFTTICGTVLTTLVNRYLPVLQSLNALPEAKAHTIKVVATFWKRNTQFLEIILDKFMNYRVLDPASIISWILSADNLQQNYSRYATFGQSPNLLSHSAQVLYLVNPENYPE